MQRDMRILQPPSWFFTRYPLVTRLLSRTLSAQCKMGAGLRVLVSVVSLRFRSFVDCLHFCFTNGLSFCSAQVRAVKSGKVFILCYHFDSRKLIYLQHFSLFLQHLLQICLRDQFRAIYLEAHFKLDSTILLKNIFKNLVPVHVVYFFPIVIFCLISHFPNRFWKRTFDQNARRGRSREREPKEAWSSP